MLRAALAFALLSACAPAEPPLLIDEGEQSSAATGQKDQPPAEAHQR